MKHSIAFIVLGTALLLGACGPARYYVIAYPAQSADEVLPFVAMAAQSKGYQANLKDDYLAVILDDSAWLKFTVLGSNQPELVFWVILDEDGISGEELESKFSWGKRIGDELWKLAMQIKSGAEIPASTSP